MPSVLVRQLIVDTALRYDEEYAGHVKILKEAQNESTPRFLILSRSRSGQGFLHKGKMHEDGAVSIRRSWNLTELRVVEVEGLTIFRTTFASSYRWETEDAHDQAQFVDRIVNLFQQLTLNNKPLKTVGWNPVSTGERRDVIRCVSARSKKGMRPPEHGLSDEIGVRPLFDDGHAFAVILCPGCWVQTLLVAGQDWCHDEVPLCADCSTAVVSPDGAAEGSMPDVAANGRSRLHMLPGNLIHFSDSSSLSSRSTGTCSSTTSSASSASGISSYDKELPPLPPPSPPLSPHIELLQEDLPPVAPIAEEYVAPVSEVEPTAQGPAELQVTLESSDPFSIVGGFGDIFIGWDGSGNKVAAKRARCTSTGDVEPDKLLRRLRREGETWQRLHHVFVLPFLGMSCIGGRLHLVSPFVGNGSLSVYIRSHPDADRVRLVSHFRLCVFRYGAHRSVSGQLRESADAIAYLHRQGILHGDIKASNVLVSDDAHALVCDFGLSRAVDAMTSSALKGAGSVRWQAPELWRKQPKSIKTDVYAFGMLITEVWF
ncbi:hypothetical protein FRB99_003047 [Tulasnella sp. 403]|nr:hypothetical protein FRB99_003047 [Tulasnella sp. 403]